MQGRENTSGDLMSLVFVLNLGLDCKLKFSCRLQRSLDPPGSAYRSETGGLMSAIRVLTVEQSELQIRLFGHSLSN